VSNKYAARSFLVWLDLSDDLKTLFEHYTWLREYLLFMPCLLAQAK